MGVLGHLIDTERKLWIRCLSVWAPWTVGDKMRADYFLGGLGKCPPLPRALLCSKQLKMKNSCCRAGRSESRCDNVAFRNNGVPLAWDLFRSLSTQLHLLYHVKHFVGDFSVFSPGVLACSYGFRRCFEWPPIWTADLVWAHKLWGGIDLSTVAGPTVPQ